MTVPLQVAQKFLSSGLEMHTIDGALAQVKAVLRRLAGTPPSLLGQAVEQWTVAPAARVRREAVVILKGQTDRIRATEFASLPDVIAGLNGCEEEYVGPTVARRFRDVQLRNGVLRSGRARLHLEPRQRGAARGTPEIDVEGAIYDSWVGRKWFGSWLLDDCLTAMLAEPCGAITLAPAMDRGHIPDYEARLGMAPRRLRDARFAELILFDDLPNNPGKGQRAGLMRERLVGGRDTPDVPGVFLLRGTTGARRVLVNEEALAEMLAVEYGFRIMDPARSTVEDLIRACSGARVIAGVEGSQLAHGLAVMPDHATLLTLQPPDRVTLALKLMTDRRGQRFAAVIGERAEDGFAVDPDDVRRTMDLLR